jgi:hypothetical protein
MVKSVVVVAGRYSANTAHGFRRSGIFTYGDI